MLESPSVRLPFGLPDLIGPPPDRFGRVDGLRPRAVEPRDSARRRLRRPRKARRPGETLDNDARGLAGIEALPLAEPGERGDKTLRPQVGGVSKRDTHD